MGSNKVIIDGCNVAECNRYCKVDNYNEPNKCWSDISEDYKDCKPKDYQCYFYVKEIEEQLQRAKAENEELKKLNVNHLKIINNFLHENNILKEENGTLQEIILKREQTDREGLGCKYPSVLELSVQLSKNTTIELEKQKAENEKLKERVKQLDEMTGIYSVRLMEKYKKALEEIKVDFINHTARNGITKFENEIFLKIDKVLND